LRRALTRCYFYLLKGTDSHWDAYELIELIFKNPRTQKYFQQYYQETLRYATEVKAVQSVSVLIDVGVSKSKDFEL
jgi:hypothetical protein